MSFPEDEGGGSGAANPLKESKYYQFVFPVVFFGAIGMIIWYLGSGLMHLGEANNQIENPNFLTGKSSPPPTARAAGADEKSSAEAAPDEAPVVSITRVEEEAPSRPASQARRTPPPAAVTEWRLRGAVYDLTTLKPIRGAQLTFADETTNRTITTRSDSAGRYRVIVPPLDGRGYAVAVDKNGYAPNYLDPGTEGVREKEASERKSIARDLASTLSAAPATIQSASAEPLVTDFYLAPRP